MTRIDRFAIRLASPALVALALTGAQARGFGGGYSGGAIGPRTGAWGRPLGPVRPGAGFGWRGGSSGYAFRHPGYAGRWYGGYGYGLGGLGLGLGLGGLGLGGLFGDPFYGDGYIYARPVYAPPVYVAPAETPAEGEPAEDLSAVAACARRFETYDPVTQTYIGKGYVRRHCP